jgi:hypothetical protein
LANRGRPVTFDWAHTPHKKIAYPPERRDAIARAAASMGISAHVLIQRFITAGLAVLDPPGGTS